MTTHSSRGYQTEIVQAIEYAWASGAQNVMPVLPTGGGKTFVVARVIERGGVPAACVAHRSELVSQMSMALAREGIAHRVIGPDGLRRGCASLHMGEFGRSYYDPNSPFAVCGVDTLVRMDPNDPWFRQVGVWVMDEGHHVLAKNKWGRACSMFVNARGLAPTATPIRADGQGLGRQAHGLMDAMVEGPTMRELIDDGYLTDYRVILPPSDLDLSQVHLSAGGDYSPKELKAARRRSHITGDVVKHYLRFAPGKLGVTFDTDIESATETARAFRDAGVPAEVVTGETPDALRTAILRRFRNREVLQLVNVDLFGEGFDLPAIEVVSMARPTESFSLFCQQFGRSLRLMLPPPLIAGWEGFTSLERKEFIAHSGKPKAIIIDHVGNVHRHGLPDRHRVWSLDARDRRSRAKPDDAIPLRTCLKADCMAPYERVLLACPFCGTAPVPADRSKPEFVDGDLVELDPGTLAALRGEIARIDAPPVFPRNLPPEAMGAIQKQHYVRQQAQADLRSLIALWAGWQRHLGRPDGEAYRRFFYSFRVDVASAQSLGAREATELAERLRAELTKHKVQKGAIQ